ncbi:MAG: DAK2 domain-containing protein [Anaerolineaceae bacterium]
MTQNLDLSTIFGEITKTLVANQQALNDADKTNHNHGDNMVKTFQTAKKAVASGKDKTPAQQLEYAAERLKKTAKNGSGQIYAEGFTRAAKKFEGKSLTTDSIGTLIEALMGSNQPSQPQQQSQPSQGGDGDLLTTLLGSLVDGQTSQQPQQQPEPKPQQSQGGGDLLTTLLGGLMGGEQQTQQSQPEPQQNQGEGDLLTTLLGGLLGGEQQPQQQASQPQESEGDGDLLTTLLGGLMGGEQQTQQSQPVPQQSQGEGDLLTTLLGGLLNGEQQPQQQVSQPQESQGGGLIETLLGSLLGGGGSSSQQSQPSPEDLIGSLLGSLGGRSKSAGIDQKSGIDAGDLLSGALSYYAAKKSGSTKLEAIMKALSKSSPLGSTPERTQSGALVIQTLMKILGTAG